MLLILCYIELVVSYRAELLVKHIEAVGIQSIGEARLAEIRAGFGLGEYDDKVRVALLNNGWAYYGDEDEGEWRDDTRESSLDDLHLSANLDTSQPNPTLPEKSTKPSAADQPDERDWRWH